MTELYELLYDYAWRQTDLTRWLLRTNDVQDYHRCMEEADGHERQLRELLGKPEREVLLSYINSTDVRAAYERKMLFCQGLAMGLELGLWVRPWNTDPGALR